MGTPETHSITDTSLKRIAGLSAQDPVKQFNCLMQHFNEESLAACYHALDGRKAVGVEGVSKAQYGEHLEENLKDLVSRMKRMAYRPGPVRRVLIPQDDRPNAKRALGIESLRGQAGAGDDASSLREPL